MEANYLSALRENVFKINSAAAAYETTVILDNAHKLFEQCKTLRTELEHTQKEKFAERDKHESQLKEQAHRLKSEYDAQIKMMQGARTVVQEYPGNRTLEQAMEQEARIHNDAVMREKPEIDRTNLATRFAQWLDDHPDAGPTYKKLFQVFLSTLPQSNV